MTRPITPTDATAQHAEVQLTLRWSEAQRLRVVLPGLLRALTDRPASPPRQRERPRQTRAAIESVLSTLSNQLHQAQEAPESD